MVTLALMGLSSCALSWLHTTHGAEVAGRCNFCTACAIMLGYLIGNLVLLLMPWLHKRADVKVLSHSALASVAPGDPSGSALREVPTFCCGLLCVLYYCRLSSPIDSVVQVLVIITNYYWKYYLADSVVPVVLYLAILCYTLHTAV